MALKNAPYKAGDRIAIMPNGYSLVPGVILAAWQGNSGSWRGDVITEDGVLENRSLHRDYVTKASGLAAGTRDGWGQVWERLEKADI
ncbi:hypothetical protein [Streptomyces sp. NPDC091879]|jgi:hypothetical protein|uniref:hypothetical protein n=1 Tax=Streptomyces sp. NPDC091879 TaxID=3366006 RepID=UPI00381D9870